MSDRRRAGGWVVAVFAVAAAVGVSGVGAIAVAAIGFLPALAPLLWNEPAQTMSESISQARRYDYGAAVT